MASSSGPTLSGLCSLISDSLSPYVVLEATAFVEDKEREVLVSLSEILRELRSWINELDSGFVKDGEEGVTNGGCLNSHSEYHQCLTRIVVDLVVFLNSDSQFIRHLSSNVLVAISEIIALYGSIWENFICLLCTCFQLTFSSILSRSSVHMGVISESEMLSLNGLKSTLKNANWNTGAAILRILHTIVKSIKEEDDTHLVELFMNSFGECLLCVPWDLLSEMQNCGDKYLQTNSTTVALVLMDASNSMSRALFLGNLLQLFCSLADPSFSRDASADSQNKPLVLHAIIDLVPKILHWCLGGEWKCSYEQILPYFRHKNLMLMMRISSQIHLRSTLILWLELLHKYFQDMLLETLFRFECGPGDCLEDSPFLSSLSQKEHYRLSHLQRQAVFLFLRCCIKLINHTEGTELASIYARWSQSSEINSIDGCSAGERGLLELYYWLRGHVITNASSSRTHRERCIDFASSLIKLYIHEDNMLFEMLLQVFSIPFTDRQILQDGSTVVKVEQDLLSVISDHFNPILLFHVLLAELQYDHQLLLDYLISRDTGTICAEYLLRCLRVISDSWNVFVELSMQHKGICQQSCKRQKVFFSERLTSNAMSSLPSLQGAAALRHLNSGENDNLVERNSGIKCLRILEAKACLLSLKDALRKLHNRKLFPYNPKVLLRRLTRFEELCNQQGCMSCH